MTHDEEHLRLLSVFHYVVGGIMGFFALFPMIHVILGLALILDPNAFEGKGEPPPVFLGWLFAIIGLVFITIGWTLAGLVLVAGRFLAGRKHYMYCLVVACLECIFMPFGTLLGVFTIIVLMRESVKQLFAANP